MKGNLWKLISGLSYQHIKEWQDVVKTDCPLPYKKENCTDSVKVTRSKNYKTLKC